MTENTSEKTLLHELFEEANKGDLAAQTDLGGRYAKGSGVARDDNQARKVVSTRSGSRPPGR